MLLDIRINWLHLAARDLHALSAIAIRSCPRVQRTLMARLDVAPLQHCKIITLTRGTALVTPR